MTEAIEITTFKLANCTCDDFIDANVEIDDWLKRQAGFRSRRLAQWNDGTVVDMLIWDSAAHGRVAMARLMNEMGHSRVHAMIDQPTVSWSVAPVRHRVS
jgi:hypothetical protein